jgi:hypothetical protein
VARAFSRLPQNPGQSVSASFVCLRPLTYWLPASLPAWPESLDTAAYPDGSRPNCALGAFRLRPGWLSDRVPVLAGWLTHALAGWLAGSRLLSTEARSPFSPPSLLSPWGEEERRWHGSNLRHAAVHFRPPAPGEPDRDRAAGGGGQENGTSGPGGRADGVARGATPGRLTW